MASAASGVTLQGFTGVNFSQILDSVLANAQVPITNLQDEVTSENTAISTLGQLSSDFTSVQPALNAINLSLSIPPVAATASDGAPFTAQASGAALAGSYAVTVAQLAAAQSIASQGYANETDSVGNGTMTIKIGGVATPITIDSSNDTLDGVAAAINSANLGVTAQVFNTGLAGAPYRLEVTSNSTGAAQSFSISSSLTGGTAPDFVNAEVGPTSGSISGTSTPTVGGTYSGDLTQGYQFNVTSGGTLGSDAITIAYSSDSGESGTITVPANYTAGTPIDVADGLTLSLSAGTLETGDQFSAAAFVPTISMAQDAKVQVGNQIVTSGSNAVSNAIPGVTLNLTSTGGPATVTVAADSNALANQISTFVSAYNQLIGDVQANTQAIPNQTPPPLAADGGLRSTLFNMGLQLGNVNLSNLGISINQQSGQLVFSQSNFLEQEALNSTAVTQALSGVYSALSPVVNDALTANTGVIAAETTSLQNQVTQNTQQIATLNQQLQLEQTQLAAEYAQIQAVVAQYQNIAQLFASSSSSSSGSSTSTSIPGSNLSIGA